MPDLNILVQSGKQSILQNLEKFEQAGKNARSQCGGRTYVEYNPNTDSIDIEYFNPIERIWRWIVSHLGFYKSSQPDLVRKALNLNPADSINQCILKLWREAISKQQLQSAPQEESKPSEKEEKGSEKQQQQKKPSDQPQVPSTAVLPPTKIVETLSEHVKAYAAIKNPKDSQLAVVGQKIVTLLPELDQVSEEQFQEVALALASANLGEVLPQLKSSFVQSLIFQAFRTTRSGGGQLLERVAEALVALPNNHPHTLAFMAALPQVKDLPDLAKYGYEERMKQVREANQKNAPEAIQGFLSQQFLDTEAFKKLFTHVGESERQELLSLYSFAGRYCILKFLISHLDTFPSYRAAILEGLSQNPSPHDLGPLLDQEGWTAEGVARLFQRNPPDAGARTDDFLTYLLSTSKLFGESPIRKETELMVLAGMQEERKKQMRFHIDKGLELRIEWLAPALGSQLTAYDFGSLMNQLKDEKRLGAVLEALQASPALNEFTPRNWMGPLTKLARGQDAKRDALLTFYLGWLSKQPVEKEYIIGLAVALSENPSAKSEEHLTLLIGQLQKISPQNLISSSKEVLKCQGALGNRFITAFLDRLETGTISFLDFSDQEQEKALWQLFDRKHAPFQAQVIEGLTGPISMHDRFLPHLLQAELEAWKLVGSQDSYSTTEFVYKTRNPAIIGAFFKGRGSKPVDLDKLFAVLPDETDRVWRFIVLADLLRETEDYEKIKNIIAIFQKENKTEAEAQPIFEVLEKAPWKQFVAVQKLYYSLRDTVRFPKLNAQLEWSDTSKQVLDHNRIARLEHREAMAIFANPLNERQLDTLISEDKWIEARAFLNNASEMMKAYLLAPVVGPSVEGLAAQLDKLSKHQIFAALCDAEARKKLFQAIAIAPEDKLQFLAKLPEGFRQQFYAALRPFSWFTLSEEDSFTVEVECGETKRKAHPALLRLDCSDCFDSEWKVKLEKVIEVRLKLDFYSGKVKPDELFTLPGQTIFFRTLSLLPLLNDPSADFTLVADGKEFKVYKFILAATLEVFRTLGTGMKDTQTKMTLEDLTADSLEELLKAIHTGELPEFDDEQSKQNFDAMVGFLNGGKTTLGRK